MLLTKNYASVNKPYMYLLKNLYSMLRYNNICKNFVYFSLYY